MSRCTPERLQLLKDRLLAAEDAYDLLMTGQAEVTVTFGQGRSVTYRQQSSRELDAYINRLRGQIAECQGRRARGPVRFVF